MYDGARRKAMYPPQHDHRLTYDDFVRIPDDGMRHEIIDGEHYVTASPNLRHQELVGRLHFEIEQHLRWHPGTARVFVAPLDVVMGRWDVVEPDLLMVTGDQSDILTKANVQGAPALVVEVLSEGTRRRDERLKRQLYDRAGVREYWLVDPHRQSVTVCRRAATDALSVEETLSTRAHDQLTTPLLTGFALPLDVLFA